jgi:hypothetical protein
MEVSMDTFSKRFLHARDGDLTPQESYCTRIAHPHFAPTYFLGLVRPLEMIEQEDIAEALIVAALSPCRNLTLQFRILSGELYIESIERSIMLMEEWHMSRLIGHISALKWDDLRGEFFISLYNPKDLPPEHQQLITIGGLLKLLAKFGYEPYVPEKITRN